MKLGSLSPKSPPTRLQPAPKSGAANTDSTVLDALLPTRNTGFTIGAGLMAGMALLSATGCVAPPPSQPQETIQTQLPTESQTTADSIQRDDGQPLSELQLRERELNLRERELSLREKEVGIYSKAEQQNTRLRTLAEQREAHEKAKRTGEAIGNTITVLDGLGQLFLESANSVLK